MEQLLFSLNATIPVFLVMVIGYVLQQLHVTNDSFVKTLNSFNYKLCAAFCYSFYYSFCNFTVAQKLPVFMYQRDYS